MINATENVIDAASLLALVDLTSLNSNDTDQTIIDLCSRAITSNGTVAAVCIYPQFITLAKQQLQATAIKVATVVNFPSGEQDLATTQTEIAVALAAGVDEIDVVAPYSYYLNGNRASAQQYLKSCRMACGDGVLLKVILETGALETPELIAAASQDAIDAGADFIKTSTGKIAVGATLDAATTMLKTIKSSGKAVGFKASGGIATRADAEAYYKLAANILGEQWISPRTMRFGASRLLNDLIN